MMISLALALIRATGGEVLLDTSGGLTLRNVQAQLIPLAKADKASIVDCLRTEALHGSISYQNSAKSGQLELATRRLSAIENRSGRTADTTRLRSLFVLADERLMFDENADVSDLAGEVLTLCRKVDIQPVNSPAPEQPMLQGHELYMAVIQTFCSKYNANAFE